MDGLQNLPGERGAPPVYVARRQRASCCGRLGVDHHFAIQKSGDRSAEFLKAS